MEMVELYINEVAPMVGRLDETGRPRPDDIVYQNTYRDSVYMVETCRELGVGLSVSIFEPGFLRFILAYHAAGALPPGSLIKLYFGAGKTLFGLPPTRAALEAWADMVGSLAVLIAAALIKLTGWQVVDPILAVLIGLWVLPRTWTLVREAVNVLLEGVPKGTDLKAVRAAILGQAGVSGVHDLHEWRNDWSAVSGSDSANLLFR